MGSETGPNSHRAVSAPGNFLMFVFLFFFSFLSSDYIFITYRLYLSVATGLRPQQHRNDTHSRDNGTVGNNGEQWEQQQWRQGGEWQDDDDQRQQDGEEEANIDENMRRWGRTTTIKQHSTPPWEVFTVPHDSTQTPRTVLGLKTDYFWLEAKPNFQFLVLM